MPDMAKLCTCLHTLGAHGLAPNTNRLRCQVLICPCEMFTYRAFDK
jgi:hypothetical protein